ncbi:long-chain-fatty-acid--CoA ligase [Mycobacterium sp. pW049]|uniref:long-chain-fatty-acid--CoA ligase n=1 Tax=[Mycobacterium] bulgaricum TaxID=3238985 RepID=UPI00351B89A5
MTDVCATALTPLSFLERSSRVWADKVAVVDGTRRLTYADLGRQTQLMARALIASGIDSGDRVAVLLPNVTEMLTAHFGVPLARAVLVAINTRLAVDEIRYILEHSGAKMLFVHPDLLGVAAAALRTLSGIECVVTSGADASTASTHLSWSEFIGRAGESWDLPWTVEDENSAIALNYTSGTTGRPKGVLYTHRGAYLTALGVLVHCRHSTDSVFLWTLPMFHCNGWCTAWAVTAIGGRHICLEEVRPDKIWNLLRDEGVTHFNGAPTVITGVINAPEASPVTTPVIVATGGAPPSPTTMSKAEGLGIELIHMYGLTETYGPYAICEIQDTWPTADTVERFQLKARQGVGMIQADALRVVGEDMSDVAADGVTVGEIVMRGNNVMAGYFRDVAGTEEAFRGGWFHSGDLGVMHPDGYVELRDRAKDVVISGGENISTIEVEHALVSHPSVVEVAVVGVPDAKWGERPKAFVVTHSGVAVTEAELIEHVRQRIARFKAPREIEFVAELPKTATGKIQKFVLKEREWANQTARIGG